VPPEQTAMDDDDPGDQDAEALLPTTTNPPDGPPGDSPNFLDEGEEKDNEDEESEESDEFHVKDDPP